MSAQYERDLVSHTPGEKGAEITLTVEEVVKMRRSMRRLSSSDPQPTGTMFVFCSKCGLSVTQGFRGVACMCGGTFRRVTFDRGAVDAGGSPTLRDPRTVAKTETVRGELLEVLGSTVMTSERFEALLAFVESRS